MRVPAPKIGPFKVKGIDGDEMDTRMDTEFHGLGVHINYVQVGNVEARMIHCTTPIEDVPKGFEKVNAFRRWIQEELLGEPRPMRKNSIPTGFVPAERLVEGHPPSASS